MNEKKMGFILFIIGLILLISGLLIIMRVGTKNITVAPENSNESDVVDNGSKEIVTMDEKNGETIVNEETDINIDLKTFSKLLFKKNISNRSVGEINGEELIRLLFSLNNNLFTSTTGTKLKETAHDYLGIDNVDFVDITCSYFDKSDTNVLYTYNKDIDKYDRNPNHGSHGFSQDGINYYFFDGKESSDQNYYIYSVGLIYYYNGCKSEVCGPTSSMDIYLSYEDIVNKTNKVMNAIENSNLCKKVDYGEGYECNLEEISKAVTNPKTVNFYYKKVNDKYVFVKYEIK